MNCTRETELLEALQANRWPDACGTELRAHVSACSHCADLALVAHEILTDATATMHEAAIPSSGAMWWRIQRRARAEATRSATRTIVAVQAFSVIAVAVIAAVFLGGVPSIAHGWHELVRNFSPLASISLPLMLGVATCLALAPVAIYYAVTD